MSPEYEIVEHSIPETNELALRLGNKCLTLSLAGPENPEFVASIVNENVNAPRVSGATSALYTRANEIMQKIANDLDIRLTYTFITDNERMIDWARVHGRRIFNWTVRYDGENEYVAERIFDPDDS